MAHIKTIKRRYAFVLGFMGLLVLVTTAFFFMGRSAFEKDVLHEQAQTTLADVTLKSCPFFDTNGAVVRCYAITVFAAAGAKIILPVVVFSRHVASAAEALVHIPGGPGDGDQTSLANLEFWSYWYSEQAIGQDLVLFNPRGLRGSAPYWNCDGYDERAIESANQNLPYLDEQKNAYYGMTQCIDQLLQWQRDTFPTVGATAFFSPQTQADDVNRMLDLLGYDGWHFWGVSFGTRVALLAASHRRVKSLVLDGVYPMEQGGIASLPAMLNRAMGLWEAHYARFLRSDNRAHLQKTIPSFRYLLNQVLARLDEKPLVFSVELWQYDAGFSLAKNARVGPRKIDFVINRQRMLSLLFYVLYSPTFVDSALSALVDSVSVSNAQNDDFTLIVEAFVNAAFDEGFNSTLFFMAECVERKQVTDTQLQLLLGQQFSASFPSWQAWVRAEHTWDVCRHPVFNSPDKGRQYWQYQQKPTLIISGELDPVTPPQWGEILSEKIKSSKHIVVKGAAHGALLSGYCNSDFWSEFLQTTNINQIINCEVIQ